MHFFRCRGSKQKNWTVHKCLEFSFTLFACYVQQYPLGITEDVPVYSMGENVFLLFWFKVSSRAYHHMGCPVLLVGFPYGTTSTFVSIARFLMAIVPSSQLPHLHAHSSPRATGVSWMPKTWAAASNKHAGGNILGLDTWKPRRRRGLHPYQWEIRILTPGRTLLSFLFRRSIV